MKVNEKIILKLEKNANSMEYQKFKKALKLVVSKSLGKMYEMKDILSIEGFEKVYTFIA